MNLQQLPLNGGTNVLVEVHPLATGEYRAQVVGLPGMEATATGADEAIRGVIGRLDEWIKQGRIVVVNVTGTGGWLRLPDPIDPSDPDQEAYLAELARRRQEDLERTLREYASEDASCCDSSSTPTT